MRLDVPLVRQKPDTQDCGFAVLAMLEQYYGKDISTKKIKKKMGVTENEFTFMPQLALYLMKQGYETNIITCNPHLFVQKNPITSQKEMKRYMGRRFLENKDPLYEKSLEYFMHYTKKGGVVTQSVPGLDYLGMEIHQGNPVVVSLTSYVFTDNVPKFNQHFNLVTGYDTNHIYVNDPGATTGGKLKYTHNDFRFAVYASAHGDTDNASFLLVKRPLATNTKRT